MSFRFELFFSFSEVSQRVHRSLSSPAVRGLGGSSAANDALSLSFLFSLFYFSISRGSFRLFGWSENGKKVAEFEGGLGKERDSEEKVANWVVAET